MMRQLRIMITFIILTISAIVGFAQDNTSLITDPIYIFQSGRLILINSNSERTISSAQFSTLVSQSHSSALWAAFDKNQNQLYVIVEREPWNAETGKQLRSVVALNLVTSEEEVIYTDYYLVNAAISPDGAKLLIHKYQVGSQSVMPTASEICILDLSTNSCDTVKLNGITSQLEWINTSGFVTPVLGKLYQCFLQTVNCQAKHELENIYIDKVIKTNVPNQVLIAGQITPYDGVIHYFYYDIITHERTELVQLNKPPIYNSDNLAVIQESLSYMSLSTDGQYLIVANQLTAPEINVLDITSGRILASFQGRQPEWIGDSNILIDTVVQGSSTDVYTLNVITGEKMTIYTTNQPFNLIVP